MTTTTKPINTNNETNRQCWLTHIQQWQVSKISQEAYCKQLGLNLNSFTYWRRKLLSSTSKEVKNKFVRIKVDGNPAAISDTPRSIQIKLLSGHVVYIPANLDMGEIARLIHLLGAPHA